MYGCSKLVRYQIFLFINVLDQEWVPHHVFATHFEAPKISNVIIDLQANLLVEINSQIRFCLCKT